MNNQITWLKSTITEVSLATLTTVHSQLFGLSAAVKLNTRQCPRLGYMSEVWVFTVPFQHFMSEKLGENPT
jgi:hypothetical protein